MFQILTKLNFDYVLVGIQFINNQQIENFRSAKTERSETERFFALCEKPLSLYFRTPD